jgi:DNA-binding response OmpR family regulator
MPGRTGPELAAELRRRRPDLKVLFVTGYSENPPGNASAPVLHKPFRAGELLAAVRGVLG